MQSKAGGPQIVHLKMRLKIVQGPLTKKLWPQKNTQSWGPPNSSSKDGTQNMLRDH